MAQNPKDGSSCGCGGSPMGTPVPRPMVPLGVPRPVVMPDVWVNGIPPGSIQRLPSAKPMLMPALESPPCDCDCPCPPEALQGKASPMPPMRPPMPAAGPGGGGPGPGPGGGGGPPPGGGGGGPPPGGGGGGGGPENKDKGGRGPQGAPKPGEENPQDDSEGAGILGAGLTIHTGDDGALTQAMQAAVLETQFRDVQTADVQAAAMAAQFRTQLAMQGMGSQPTSMEASAAQSGGALQPFVRSGLVEGGMPYGGPQSSGLTQAAGFGPPMGAAGPTIVRGSTQVGRGSETRGPTLAGWTFPPIPRNWEVSAYFDPDIDGSGPTKSADLQDETSGASESAQLWLQPITTGDGSDSKARCLEKLGEEFQKAQKGLIGEELGAVMEANRQARAILQNAEEDPKVISWLCRWLNVLWQQDNTLAKVNSRSVEVVETHWGNDDNTYVTPNGTRIWFPGVKKGRRTGTSTYTFVPASRLPKYKTDRLEMPIYIDIGKLTPPDCKNPSIYEAKATVTRANGDSSTITLKMSGNTTTLTLVPGDGPDGEYLAVQLDITMKCWDPKLDQLGPGSGGFTFPRATETILLEQRPWAEGD